MKYYEDVKDLFLDGEIFKNIEEYDGDYQVSNFGRIKSFKYDKINGKILKQNKNNSGYLYVKLSKNGKSKTKRIHFLMFKSFICKIPEEGYIVHHLDFTKNNTLDNFQLMSIFEHKSLHSSGKNNPCFGRNGENHLRSILKEQDVIAMKSFWNNNIKISNKLLAKWYKVSPVTVSQIKTERSWKHIKLI